MTTPLRTHTGALRVLVLFLPICLALSMAACGPGRDSEGETSSGGSEESEPTSEMVGSRREVPTMPAARFAQPTTMIDPTRMAASQSTPEAEDGEPDVELGAQTYAQLCAECHGEDGEGVAGTGEALTDYGLDEAGLTDLLRSGGDSGDEHIFDESRISEEDIAALHAFLQSLGSP